MIDNFQGFTIQTFDDQKRKNKGYLTKIFLYDPAKIKKLNSKGAGIYFVPNPQIDPNKRSIENTRALKYLLLDLDVSKEKQRINQDDIKKRKTELFNKLKSLTIPPNHIIETKNGLQPLWELVKNISLTSIEERIKMNEQYKSIIAGFSTKTGLDSEGDNLCRLLRYPGAYHLKNPDEPFLITITKLNPDKVTLDEFIKVYPPITKKISPSIQCEFKLMDSAIDKIIKYPVQEALRRLSGTEAVDFERFDFHENTNGTIQLIVNDEIKGQWIDPTHNTIGGAGKGSGNPTIIQFLQWYGVNRRGENDNIAKSKAIKALKRVLSLSDDEKFTESQSFTGKQDTNTNTNLNKNGGFKQSVNFELTQSRQEIIEKLKKCNYRTSRIELAKLLEEFFKDWGIYPRHCLYVAQHWNPRAICRTINEIVKKHESGQVTIHNPAKYFTKLIRFRKERRS